MISSKSFVLNSGACSLGNDDPKFASSGLFFPSKGHTTALEKLKFYSRSFSSIEIDNSSYQMLQKKSYIDWASSTPTDFLFHFKVFGIFTLLPCRVDALPWQVKEKLTSAQKMRESLSLSDFESNPSVVDLLWKIFNETMEPFFARGKLGLVIFQFQASFQMTDASFAYLDLCRSRLDRRFLMAVELRSHSFFADSGAVNRTVEFCRARRLVLIGWDELAAGGKTSVVINDVKRFDSPPPPLGTNAPLKWSVCALTHPSVMLLRIHRRSGSERMLSDDEHRALLAQIRRALEEAKAAPWPALVPEVKDNDAISCHLETIQKEIGQGKASSNAGVAPTNRVAANAEPLPSNFDAYRTVILNRVIEREPPKVFVIWNTNWSNQSFLNAAKLDSLLMASPSSASSAVSSSSSSTTGTSSSSSILQPNDWKEKAKEAERSSKKSILSFFSPSPAKKQRKQ